ncbi:teneurin-a-like [Gigantopelta aegis]|uniref:teneurin-a-like n=1 Tax=Gigantopelta aegis TaxID=1735272 RepID=UPI001B887910|nr:teneurin-a-like [Gigantopelta aegis]
MTLLKLYAMLAGTVVILSTSLNAVQGICNKTCSRNGVLSKDTCKCDCEGNWKGDICDECDLVCHHFGCLFTPICECQCRYYWAGITCEDCTLKCVHGYLTDSCICTCDEDWVGDRCETCNLICENGASLRLALCRCDCMEPWTGKNCDQRPLRVVVHETEGLGVGVGSMVVLAIASLVTITTSVVWVIYFRKRRNANDGKSSVPNKDKKVLYQADNLAFPI